MNSYRSRYEAIDQMVHSDDGRCDSLVHPLIFPIIVVQYSISCELVTLG